MTKETAKRIAEQMLFNVLNEIKKEHAIVSKIVAEACNNALPPAIKALVGTEEGKQYLNSGIYVYWMNGSYDRFMFIKDEQGVIPYVIEDRNNNTVRIPENSNCYSLIEKIKDKYRKFEEHKEQLEEIIYRLKTEKRILEHFPDATETIRPFFVTKKTEIICINDKLKELVSCSIVKKEGCEV